MKTRTLSSLSPIPSLSSTYKADPLPLPRRTGRCPRLSPCRPPQISPSSLHWGPPRPLVAGIPGQLLKINHFYREKVDLYENINNFDKGSFKTKLIFKDF